MITFSYKKYLQIKENRKYIIFKYVSIAQYAARMSTSMTKIHGNIDIINYLKKFIVRNVM
jgi:hypothetical protein